MQQNQVYKCDACKAVVEVLVAAQPDAPVCCGVPMQALTENTVDAAKEKHVPVIEKVDGGYKVKVGAVPHPMTPEHYITTIELIAGNQVLRANLTPTDTPEAVFKTDATAVKAREYCNLHGLWTA
ncbi:MAG: desulfoferrodoxin [Planctomycetaceae bacterium]|nr:desulfoferrodoxin [Planctomycetaceae bacterium]